MNTLTNKNLFVDELDGKWTLGWHDEKGGSESLCTFEEEDSWLYPEDLNGFDNVVNIFKGFDNEHWFFNVYSLPENWKDIVTQDNGKDGKESILDIMIADVYII